MNYAAVITLYEHDANRMAKSNRIFTAFAEVKPLAGSELDADDIAGAFVRCHIPATDAEGAIQRLAKDLAERKIRLIGTEWCVDHDVSDWENPDDSAEKALVDDARENGRITYGDFHTWGYDAPDAT